MATLGCDEKVLVNDEYYFKLAISILAQKLYIEVYNKEGNLIEKDAFINFDTLKQRLELKLSILAVVCASKRILNNILHFRYYKRGIYKLISFEKFIELLKQDLIRVDIVGMVSRSGSETGRQRNKNLVFRIKKKNIIQLFEVVEIYDKDDESRFQIL